MVPMAQPMASISFFFIGRESKLVMDYDDINFCTLSFGRSSPLCTPLVEDLYNQSTIVESIKKNRNRLALMVGRLGFVDKPPKDRVKLVQYRVKNFSSRGVRESVDSCPVIVMSTWIYSLNYWSYWVSVLPNKS